MKKLFIALAALALQHATATAQKTVYIPWEWANAAQYHGKDTLLYAENDPDNIYTWSKSRSKESENFIVFWDKGYGNTSPSDAPSSYKVDIDDLLAKAETYYELEVNRLKFADPATSNLSKYKGMIMLNHTTSWICSGAGYDYQVPGLWVCPWACSPVGLSVAHEVGHTFQYMCYSEASEHDTKSNVYCGFHSAIGSGSGIWEQTAQWQALQSYPGQMYSESIGYFRNSHNYAFTHEWHRYQSYWFLYYLCQYYDDITVIGDIWNHQTKSPSDFNQTLMSLKGLSVKELYKMYFDYACRMVTWDIDACVNYRNPYIGDFNYYCSQTGDKEYQVALASCPQSTGFNVIPLAVPEAGTEVKTVFTALRTGSDLAGGDPAQYLNGDAAWVNSGKMSYNTNPFASSRGFRYGYVALLSDGTRQYFSDDNVHCTGLVQKQDSISMTVPENTVKLWFVVSPALKSYAVHLWDDDYDKNDDLWPYKVKFEGTDIGSRATVYVEPEIDGREIADITLEYDLYFPANSSAYTGTTCSVSGTAAAALATAFQMTTTDIANNMQAYSSAGPTAGKVMFYGCNSTGGLANSGSTAIGYGHWFNSNGDVGSWSSGGVLFSEFTPASMTFSIGQYPGKLSNGDNYTIRQALRHKDAGGKTATAYFVFNIHLDASRTEVELKSIESDSEPSGIRAVTVDRQAAEGIYTTTGIKLDTQVEQLRPGIYIIKGRKIGIK